MKRLLLIGLCMGLAAGAGFAQPPGVLVLSADPQGLTCDVYDQMPGLIVVYVVHAFTPGAKASQFKVDHWSYGAVLTFLGEMSPYPTVLGTSPNGIAIAYGACVPSPNMILTINFFGSGMSSTCSYIRIVPDPNALPPAINVVDCAIPGNLHTTTGGYVAVNPDPSCMCDVPVQETTWGGIKSLYR